MNIVIDIGNSTAKVGIFERELLKQNEVFDSHERLREFLKHHPADHLLISSVKDDAHEVGGWAEVKTPVLYLEAGLSLPIVNRYQTPATLGVDRLAAACGAWATFPGASSLVIDAGTCINYEFVNAQAEYLGGIISPGVRMRFESMHRMTARLPLVTPVEVPPLTGSDTGACLRSGVMNGVLEEMKGIIHRYKKDYPGTRVILCGGDAHFFENHLKPAIFVAPDLVLKGLNSILMHHV